MNAHVYSRKVANKKIIIGLGILIAIVLISGCAKPEIKKDLLSYSIKGCIDKVQIPAEIRAIEYLQKAYLNITVQGNYILFEHSINHLCMLDLKLEQKIFGNEIILNEFFSGPGAKCQCHSDLNGSIGPLTAGEYNFKLYQKWAEGGIDYLVNESKIIIQASAEEKTLSFETISTGAYSGYAENANLAINDAETFSQIWNKTFSIQIPLPKEPQINFNELSVIAVFMGMKNTGGYSIEIVEIVDEPAPPGVRCGAQTRCVGKVVIYVKETKPKPGEMATQALTQPYHIVKTEKITKPIEFKKLE